ncbi:MFS transporter [Chryseotalea sanaruensis]|uniref:MFS transporter n=1 Tax=Chryseotalea sanaruensis TaxID=2482724 RepID=A0A401UCD0_9BACT|nr:MFS transporter [Chryseotalea sanaruensis]GCC52530.1 MFS transporter [Chryseotalea sanaruensis]
MTKHDAYAALKVKDFRLFVSARFFITLAINLQAVIVGWQVYELTHDPLSLGLIGLAEALPSITVSLYAGHVADIVQRKKIILTCISILVLCSVALLLFSLNTNALTIQFGVVPIYAVIFLSGLARGFLTPANFAYMPQLVPREIFKNAITWNSSFWQTALIAGPALGGFIYGFFGLQTAYVVDVSLTCVALLLISFVSRKSLPAASDEQSTGDKIRAGLKFVFSNKLILGAISLDLFAVLFGGAVALLPIFAKEVLHAGAEALGLLRSAPPVGALIVAFYIAHNPINSKIGRKLLWSVAGFGLCMIAFSLSTNFWLSLGILMLSGGFDGVSVIIRSTLLQTLTPENMKGRISAVNNIFIGSSNEIGMFESGLAARLMGLVPSVIFGGAMTLLTVSITAWKAPSLRKLENLD